ncbi:hypothetical protein ACYJW8_02215 [Frateuria aurantia]
MSTRIHGINPIPAAILDYLKSQHVLSLATNDAQGLWAANVFYAVEEARQALLFLSETSTRHGSSLLVDARVAGTISDQQRDIALLQGLQLTGTVRSVRLHRLHRAWRDLYNQRIPEAAGRMTPLWLLQLETLKFTDNTQRFGHKSTWIRT